ncbi:MAG: class II aldolase/adducin family protein [Candidatus Kariarchaeaceae archaeon]|jgi:ribulose-5-phosphate 4-epimerase/fuculose-1-phosphate aldolase
MSENYIGVKFQPECLGSLRELETDLDSYFKLLRNLLQHVPKISIQDGVGNVSVRVHEKPSLFLITATGIDLTAISSIDDFCIVSKTNDPQVFYYGSNIPSSESPMHAIIYNSLSEVDIIFHSHPQNIAMLSKHPKLSITNQEFAYGTFDVGKPIVDLLRSSPIAVLRNHGIVIVGTSTQDILNQINNLKLFEEE